MEQSSVDHQRERPAHQKGRWARARRGCGLGDEAGEFSRVHPKTSPSQALVIIWFSKAMGYNDPSPTNMDALEIGVPSV